VLVALPPLNESWTDLTESTHVLNAAAAWWGQPAEASTGNATQTVRIPVDQRLDVAAFEAMMDQA
jgi:hypothetical protein